MRRREESKGFFGVVTALSLNLKDLPGRRVAEKNSQSLTELVGVQQDWEKRFIPAA